jgi:hypothetical protein
VQTTVVKLMNRFSGKSRCQRRLPLKQTKLSIYFKNLRLKQIKLILNEYKASKSNNAKRRKKEPRRSKEQYVYFLLFVFFLVL